MWMIEKVNGILYDEKKHELKTVDGEYLASVEVNEYGLLEIWLGMNVNFMSDSGEIHGVGWNGCEEHMGDRIFLKDEGGTLDYQKNRCSFSEKAGKNINIKIVKLEGILICAQPQAKNCLRGVINSMKSAFVLKQNMAQN